MATPAGNNFTAFNNVFLQDSLGVQFLGRTSDPTDSDLAAGRTYYNSTANALKVYNGSTWTQLGASGAGSTPSWATIYASNVTFPITSGTWTITQSSANALITLNKTNVNGGAVIDITNSGTGADIRNSTTWSLAVAAAVGVLELSSGGTINATGGACTIGKAGTATTLSGSLTVAQGATITASGLTVSLGGLTVSAGGLTVTAGGFTVSAGVNSFTATSNTAASILLTNNSITTYGVGGQSTGMVQFVSTSMTSGTMLNIQVTEGTFTSGNYIRCWDANAGAATFSVARYGATTIAGTAAGTAALTLTTGDIVVSSGSVLITRSSNNATVSITNNSATSNALFAVIGSGVYTGSGTSSFVTFQPSGLTTGTILDLTSATLTTGKVINSAVNALTTGTVVAYSSTSNALTSGGFVSYTWNPSAVTSITAGKLVSVADSPTINATVAATHNDVAIVRTITTAAAAITYTPSGSVLLVNNASPSIGAGSTLTDSAIVLDVQQNSATSTGAAISVTDAKGAGATNQAIVVVANSLTTGQALKITANGLTTGAIVSLNSSGTYTGSGMWALTANSATTGTLMAVTGNGLTTTGVGLSVSSTGTGMTSGSLLLVSSGTTAAVATNGIVSLAATAAFTSASNAGFVSVLGNSTTAGTIMSISGTALTTGQALYISSTGTGITTGSLLYLTTGTTGAINTNGVVSINATAAYTSTSNNGLLNVLANSTTGGTIVNVAGNALTTGVALNITSAGGAAYTGTGFVTISNTSITSGVELLLTGSVTTGTALQITSTGAYTGSAGVFAVTANSATTGTVCVLNGTALTSGFLLKSSNGATLTTGGLFLLQDNSADVSTRALFEVDNNNSAATGVSPIKTKNTALQGTGSKFTKILTHTDGSKTTTIWLSTDGTTPNANLTATAGDLCLNGPSSRSFYCTGANNWTASNA